MNKDDDVGEITHKDIHDELRAMKTMQLWIIAMGVSAIGGLGMVSIQQGNVLASAVATQTAVIKRLEKGEEDVLSQRRELTVTLQNINNRLFELSRKD